MENPYKFIFKAKDFAIELTCAGTKEVFASFIEPKIGNGEEFLLALKEQMKKDLPRIA